MDRCQLCDEPLKPGQLKCKSCGKWNVTDNPDNDGTVLLSNIDKRKIKRIPTGEWDYIFGPTKPPYGLPCTYTILLGGLPGAGKSTWTLQLCAAVAKFTKREILYIAAEEGLEDISDRAERLQLDLSQLRMLSALTGGITMPIETILDLRKPSIVVLDSLKGFCGNDDAAQVEICKIMKRFAVKLQSPVIIINHVNKDNDLAGLLELQHTVDVVLLMYPDEQTGIRTVEVHKNRGGRAFITCDMGMTETGLVPIPPEENEDE